jgi:hypothetical protein
MGFVCLLDATILGATGVTKLSYMVVINSLLAVSDGEQIKSVQARILHILMKWAI